MIQWYSLDYMMNIKSFKPWNLIHESDMVQVLPLVCLNCRVQNCNYLALKKQFILFQGWIQCIALESYSRKERYNLKTHKEQQDNNLEFRISICLLLCGFEFDCWMTNKDLLFVRHFSRNTSECLSKGSSDTKVLK